MNSVYNVLSPACTIARIGCYATAGFLAGRKLSQVAMGSACVAASKVAAFVENKKYEGKFDTLGKMWFKAAKEDLKSDLKLAAISACAGLVLEFTEDFANLQIASYQADGSLGSLRSSLARGVAPIGEAISSLKRLYQGDQRYLSERIVDAYNTLKTNLRITPPYTASMSDFCFGYCGMGAIDKLRAVVNVSIRSLRNELSELYSKTCQDPACIRARFSEIESVRESLQRWNQVRSDLPWFYTAR